MKLVNFSEILVKEKLDEVINKSDVCKCEQCRLDIMAIALNQLPPRYVVSEQGQVFSKVQSFTAQTTVDTLGAIADAAQKVKNKPNH